MTGVLYIVATPIGNLDDISLRAIKTLQAVDLIAAEDTRHSKRLLNHLGITTKMISYHDHNETGRSSELIGRLSSGVNIALISDAGTPLISDPGYQLVNQAHQAGIRVCPIPGANSVITALSTAGLPTDSFHFFGFLAHKNNERLSRLKKLQQVDGTLVLFESSHRIQRLLEQLSDVFAANKIVVAKELTKSYERLLIGTAAEILEIFNQDETLKKGEFVVLIDNPIGDNTNQLASSEIELLNCLLAELPLKKAVEIAAKVSAKKKNELYQLALEMKNKASPVAD